MPPGLGQALRRRLPVPNGKQGCTGSQGASIRPYPGFLWVMRIWEMDFNSLGFDS